MQTGAENIWTDQQICLQQWLALPKRERKPKTHRELANRLGVDITTLTRWKKLDGFADEVRKLIRDHLEDELSEIYLALKRQAKSGSYQHIKLALELVGDYVEQSEHRVTAKVQSTVTHAIDSDTAGDIFDILKAAGVFTAAASDAEADKVHNAPANS